MPLTIANRTSGARLRCAVIVISRYREAATLPRHRAGNSSLMLLTIRAVDKSGKAKPFRPWQAAPRLSVLEMPEKRLGTADDRYVLEHHGPIPESLFDGVEHIRHCLKGSIYIRPIDTGQYTGPGPKGGDEIQVRHVLVSVITNGRGLDSDIRDLFCHCRGEGSISFNLAKQLKAFQHQIVFPTRLQCIGEARYAKQDIAQERSIHGVEERPSYGVQMLRLLGAYPE